MDDDGFEQLGLLGNCWNKVAVEMTVASAMRDSDVLSYPFSPISRDAAARLLCSTSGTCRWWADGFLIVRGWE